MANVDPSASENVEPAASEHVERAASKICATNKRPWGRWAAFVGVGTILVYLSSFFGNVAFYWSFQKVILAQGDNPGSRSMIWGTPTKTSECETSTWQLQTSDDLSFRVPPGKLGEVEDLGSAYRVEVDEFEFMVQGFPKGFVGTLLSKELHALNQDARGIGSDVEILPQVINETPENFEFGWGAAERETYAARILVKMLLFQAIPVKRSHFVTRQNPPGCAYLIEYESGESRILTAGESGSVLLMFGPDVPDSWRTTPGNWLR